MESSYRELRDLGSNINPKHRIINKQVAFISGKSFSVQQYLLNLDFNGAKTNPRLPQTFKVNRNKTSLLNV